MCCKPSRTVYESVRWSERLTTFTKASHLYTLLVPPNPSRLQRQLWFEIMYEKITVGRLIKKQTINKCCFLGAFKHKCTAQLNY